MFAFAIIKSPAVEVDVAAVAFCGGESWKLHLKLTFGLDKGTRLNFVRRTENAGLVSNY